MYRWLRIASPRLSPTMRAENDIAISNTIGLAYKCYQRRLVAEYTPLNFIFHIQMYCHHCAWDALFNYRSEEGMHPQVEKQVLLNDSNDRPADCFASNIRMVSLWYVWMWVRYISEQSQVVWKAESWRGPCTTNAMSKLTSIWSHWWLTRTHRTIHFNNSRLMCI